MNGIYQYSKIRFLDCDSEALLELKEGDVVPNLDDLEHTVYIEVQATNGEAVVLVVQNFKLVNNPNL